MSGCASVHQDFPCSLPAGRFWSQSQHTASPLCWPSRKPLPKPKLHQTCGSCHNTTIPAWASQGRGLTREGFGAAAQTTVFLEQFCKECRENSIPRSQAARVWPAPSASQEHWESSSQPPLLQPLLQGVSASCLSQPVSKDRTGLWQKLSPLCILKCPPAHFGTSQGFISFRKPLHEPTKMLKDFTYSLLFNTFPMVKEHYKNYSMALVFSTNWKKNQIHCQSLSGSWQPSKCQLAWRTGAYLLLPQQVSFQSQQSLRKPGSSIPESKHSVC